MSYKRPNTGNTMNDYFTALSDFTQLAPNLLAAKNINAFQIWLEKLELIDKRSLHIYLQKHKNEIPPDHMKLAQRRFKEVI